MIFFKHEIRMNMKSFLVWTGVIAVMVFSFMLLYTSMEDQMADISTAYASMGGFSEAFGMDKISFTTPMGFYGVENGAVLALGGGMFAAILGIGMLAKEEGGHAAEFTYVTPYSRNYFITSKFVAMAVLIAVFDVICLIAGALGFVAIDGDIEWKKYLLYHLSLYFMYLEISGICFGISAFLRKSNIGLGIGVSILFYFANIFANISKDVEGIHYVTPYYYSDAAEVFSSGKLHTNYIIVGMLMMAVVVVIGYIKYNKKDLSI